MGRGGACASLQEAIPAPHSVVVPGVTPTEWGCTRAGAERRLWWSLSWREAGGPVSTLVFALTGPRPVGLPAKPGAGEVDFHFTLSS